MRKKKKKRVFDNELISRREQSISEDDVSADINFSPRMTGHYLIPTCKFERSDASIVSDMES